MYASIDEIIDRTGFTNGDRIRAMTDEELATLFDCFSACAICEEAERLDDNPFLKDEKCDEDCEAHIFAWLKQPVEDNHG